MKQLTQMIKQGALAIMVLAGLIFISSCEKYSFEIEEVDPVIPVLFQTEIQPIFTANCIVCHKGSRNPDLRDGNSYNSLTTGGYVNLPAESSKLNSKINSGSHDGFTLPAEKQKILIWIQQGAKNN